MKHTRFAILGLSLSLLAQAQETPASTEAVSVSIAAQQIAVESAPLLEGIVFLGSRKLRKERFDLPCDGIRIEQVRLLENNPSFLRELKQEFFSEPLTDDTIARLKCRVTAFYNAQNQPFVVVSVPRWKRDDGVIQVVVEEARLGEVRVRGCEYFAPSQVMKMVRVKSGESILTQEVAEDLYWMNQNPFRKTDLIYVPGKTPGTADIELATIDRWPYRIYAGADNTGTVASMRDRIFFGFDFGKTIVPDGQIAYQFTCSPNWNRLVAHTAEARIPCPWRHVVVLYGGYSETEPEKDPGVTFDRGKSWQVDLRYRVPLLKSFPFLQTFVVGYDFKEVQSRIRETGIDPFHAVADINQFMIGYEVGAKGKYWRTSFVFEAYGNPGSITSRNKTEDYRQFRYGAEARYVYAKGAHSLAVNYFGIPMSYDLTGQISSANLLPSEQLSLAGYNAVRGFEERIVSVDTGAVLNVSIETPHVSPAYWLGSKTKWDEIYLLGFFDCGFGVDHQATPGAGNWKWLASAGPGIRYQFSRYITARFDYGFQLSHHGFENPTHSRYNFGAIISY